MDGELVFGEHLMSEIGRSCLVEIGCKSIWGSRFKFIYIYIYGRSAY